METKTEKKQTLAVSEVFSSIQGEGQTIGIPAVFLRLGGCNLLCKGAAFVCDTIEVWQKSKAIEFKDVIKKEWVERLRDGAHLVITGGEPLAHQKHIIEYLNWFVKEYGFGPIIEVETNGTIMPDETIDYYVQFWNVSPKLSSAGRQNTKEMRLKDTVLHFFNSNPKTIFKFVISNEDDVLELMTDFGDYCSMSKVVLMPAGSSQEELSKTKVFVAEKCIELGLRYSSRAHIEIWNLKTGV